MKNSLSDKPHVTTHRHIVNTAEKADAEIRCSYESSGPTKVTWLKNGKILSVDHEHRVNGKYAVFDNNQNKEKNETTLTINSVTKTDLGEYECHVKNQLGGASAKIQLEYEPEPPHLTESSQLGKEITTHWTIRSIYKLEEVQIHYKEQSVRCCKQTKYQLSIIY